MVDEVANTEVKTKEVKVEPVVENKTEEVNTETVEKAPVKKTRKARAVKAKPEETLKDEESSDEMSLKEFLKSNGLTEDDWVWTGIPVNRMKELLSSDTAELNYYEVEAIANHIKKNISEVKVYGSAAE